jgi:hypothetical protein
MKTIILFFGFIALSACSPKYSLVIVDQEKSEMEYSFFSGTPEEINVTQAETLKGNFIKSVRIHSKSISKFNFSSISTYQYDQKEVEQNIKKRAFDEAKRLGAAYYHIIWNRITQEGSAEEFFGEVHYFAIKE